MIFEDDFLIQYKYFGSSNLFRKVIRSLYHDS